MVVGDNKYKVNKLIEKGLFKVIYEDVYKYYKEIINYEKVI